MSKLRKKIVVPISLTLTGCLVVAAFVLNDSLTKVDANVAFNGISDIVSSHGKDKPFNIVEVVPDKKMASIGYLIDGQEPDDWFGTLSKMSDKEGDGVQKRADYMAGLKTKLEPITTYKKDNTKPLYYEQYEESYVSLGNDWSELALVDMDKINQGTEGYKMTKQEKGDYKFNTDYQLAVNEDGLPTGHYRQNVDHYVFMQGEDETEDGSESVDTGKRGYYSVAFTAVKLPDGMTNTQYLVGTDNSQKADGNTDSGTAGNIDSSTDNTTDTGTADDTSDKHVVYSIKSAYAIGSAEGMQNIAKYDPKAYIYRKDNSDITSPYEFVARADQMASLPDGSKPDYEKYTYCTVEMEYVPADKIIDDETYYEVDTKVPIEFNYDETGEYGAVLDSQNPSEKIDDGTPDNQPAGNTGRVILTDTDGYFDIVKDSQTYTYVGEGNGDYIMEADKNGSPDYPVNTTRIYYKGGFKNNNWFRTGVFNQEGMRDRVRIDEEPGVPASPRLRYRRSRPFGRSCGQGAPIGGAPARRGLSCSAALGATQPCVVSFGRALRVQHADFPHDGGQALGLRGGRVHERKAHASHREAQELERLFHEDGVRRFEQALHKRHERLVRGRGRFPVARRAQIHDLLHARRGHVADGGDDAGAAQAHDVERGGVVARVHGEAFRRALHDGLHLVQLPRSLLDGHDVGALVRQAQRGLGLHVNHAAARDVVQDDGQLHRVRDGAEVLVDTFLRGLVVVRHHAHEAVDAKLRHLAREVHRVGRAVVAHVRDDGHAVAHGLHHGAEQVDLLRIEHGRALPRRAVYDERVAAAVHEARGESLDLVHVELAVLVERGDHGRYHAAETGLLRHADSSSHCTAAGGWHPPRRTLPIVQTFIMPWAEAWYRPHAMKFSKPTIRPERPPTLRMPRRTPGM